MKNVFLSLLLLSAPTLLLAQFGPRTPEQDSLLARQQRKTQADYRHTTYTTLPDPLTLKDG